MRSTFSGIEVSKRSLFAQQTALQTTGHNIANANTQGYTRQVVNLVASRPMEAVGLMRSNVPGQIGTGVEFDSIKRIREGFLDQQFYGENKSYGSWTVRKDTLDKLEAITNEPSDTGLRQVIENFWNAWQVVSKEPENTTARAALKENALAMTDTFNHTATQLSELKSDLTEDIDVKAREINTMLTQVASLNREIFRIEGLGNDANDLRDQRDLLADNMSKIINITVENTASGYNINMGSTRLVEGVNVTASFETPGDTTPGTKINFEDAFQDGTLNNGEVYGLIYSRDNYVQSYQFQLDSMVKALAQGDMKITLPKGSVLPQQPPAGTVIGTRTFNGQETLTDEERVVTADAGLEITVKGLNGLHGLGYSLESPPQSGIPFFALKGGATEYNAASITLNQAIIDSPAKIASSLRVETNTDGTIKKNADGTETVVKGNNDLALLAAGMRTVRLDFDPQTTGIPILKNGSFDEFFRAIVGQLGVQTQEAIRQTDNQKALVDQIETRRQSVSGVSLDEEMANMIKYQHAYNASARALTTFDEMLDKVINSMGVVGR
ncbi:hypothetical protein PAESOLCIP111_03522 [Paenibacillus solanacearum]|uniref:Flagellar hook-associated protein 1 n=1 Tax=Paenibacillus solanacearum TaxID=2048548 RepID=A0A916K2P3_9BACL|nr:flagellar hook-associated protein FlgK [Paenibacillus solanacearum]CAG7634007.1 hypothetical protein PAESOLCIP111_03522 [Paenibacillus solanacearum]